MNQKRILKKTFFDRTNSNLINIIRYVFVGGFASVIDLGAYSLLLYYFDVNLLVSNTISFVFGLLTNYFLSRSWVFNQDSNTMSLKEFAVFGLIGIGGVIISNAILYLFVELRIISEILYFLSNDQIKFFAKIFAMFVTLLWNYFMRKKIYQQNMQI